MLNIQQNSDSISLRQKDYFFGGIIITSIMAIIGMFFLCGLLPFEEGYTFVDVFGLMFVLVWETGVIYGIFYYAKEHSTHILVDETGVFCGTCFKKEFVPWSEIKDWGISYCGQTKWEGNTYYLYFSKKQFETKNECRKKLRGKMIQITVFEDEYPQVLEKVIPFCEKHALLKPFIGKDKFHII